MAARLPHKESVLPDRVSLEKAESEPEVSLSSPPPPDVTFSHRISHHPFAEHLLDPDAAKVILRLNRFGYEAYLVGGCVRDLLFGQRPKDFDVATSALPAEMRRMFRNCRLIGRRFRLAHLFFKDHKIIEVATFRRGATSEDDISIRHAAENLFGGPADDAIRRDFTINAMMYDMVRGDIHDYVGGLADVASRTLRTVGDPNRRFPEDPVRIIRAIKFAVRLDLSIEDDLDAAVRAHAPLISTCSPARLVEEMFKILRSGRAAKCLRQLKAYGVLDVLLPELSKKVDSTADDDEPWRILERLDERIMTGRPVSDAVLLGALAYPHCKAALLAPGDPSANINESVSTLFSPMTYPKRCLAEMRQILAAQPRLLSGPDTKRSRRIMDRDYAADALNLLEATAEDQAASGSLEEWRAELAKRSGNARRRKRPDGTSRRKKPVSKEPLPSEDSPRRPRRRRRRKRTPPAESNQGQEG